MKIEIKNGYVEMKEVLDRKTYRNYNNTLFSNASMNAEGDLTANPQQVDIAIECLVLGLIKKVVVVKDEQEEEISATQEWIDNLDNHDFKKLEEVAYSIKKSNSEITKN